MTRKVSYPLSEAHAFLREYWSLSQAFERASKSMTARFGATAQQRVLLDLVGRFPGITPSSLAELLHVDAGTISTSLGRLEERKWIERRVEARDRRRIAIGLTAEGRGIATSIGSPIERSIERAIARIDHADREAFRRVVAIVVEELGRDEPPR